MATINTNITNTSHFFQSAGLVIAPSPGDGHCLLHSIITSIKSQLSEDITLESLKNQLYTESVTNISRYLQFTVTGSRGLFSTYMRQYIIYKRYNNEYGDLAPVILANTIGTTIIIINENCDSSFNEVTVTPSAPTKRKIVVHRKADHYNGCILHTHQDHKIHTQMTRTNTAAPIIKYSSDQLRQLANNHSTIKRDVRKRLFNLHLWKPTTSKRQYDVNQGVHLHLLRSLPKLDVSLQSPQHLHMAMVNTCSIRNKADDFINHNIDSDYDACFVTETWLQHENPIDNATISALNTDTHSFISCPRNSNNRGGGIGVFFKKTLKVDIVKHQNFSTFESCLFNIQSKACSILVMCVYRPPYSIKNRNTVPKFNSEFSDACSSLLANHGDKKLMIVGDFNIHMNEPLNPDTKSFNEVLDTFYLHQHVTDSTHTSGHVIDLCITSTNSELLISHPVIGYFISDHAFTSFQVDIPKPPIHKVRIKSRAISRIKKDNFRQDLIDFTSQLIAASSTSDVTELSLQYDQGLKHLLDKHAPMKSRLITPRTCVQWFDSKAKLLKAKTRKQEKIWKRTHDPADLLQLKNLRRTYRHHLHASKIAHFNDAIKQASGNSRQLFSITMGLMGKTKSNDLPTAPDDIVLANQFADFFISKILNIREDLLHSPKFTPTHSAVSELASFSAVSHQTVINIIRSSKPTTCPTDPLPSSIIKDNYDVLAPSITEIVNKSLQQGSFSDHWKMATVRPLLKKPGLDRIMTNYRPVSNLSFVSKLAEKCVVSQLNTYLSTHDLHSAHQSAYKECFSTETTLCSLMDQLLWAMEKGHASIIVALDLSAAFDTVDHEILADVLQSCFGITDKALGWITSYLNERKLRVNIRDSQSDIKCFNFSVPQGSCLGPVLFNLYCSTITNCIDDSQSLGGYADDHCLIDSFDPATPETESECIERLESSLNNISNWMASNMLKMNPSKTETAIFISKNISSKVQTKSITVAGEQVATSDHIKYLGVWFDQHLLMEKHISTKCSAAIMNIKSIASIRRFINRDTAKLLATSLVLTHLDYSNSILCGLPDKSIMRLQRIQNWAAKVVLQRDKYSSSTDALIQLHWLPIRERIDFKILCLVYKCLNNLAPSYLASRINIKTFTRNTRASKKGKTLEVPQVKKSTFAARAFSVYGPNLWNTLPPYLQESSSINTFKKYLKTELFRRAFKLR